MFSVSLTGLLLFGCWGLINVAEGAKFLLAAPTSPHIGAPYTITVTATGVEEKETVTLKFLYNNQRTNYAEVVSDAHETDLLFDQDGVKEWKVVFTWAKIKEMGQPSKLSLTMTANRNGNKEKIDLKFSTKNGHIFIQTDKPVYTPLQTIKYRILAVDESLKLAKYPIKVDLKNHNDTILDRMRLSAEDAFKKQEFDIPKETPPGNWTITASYEGLDNANDTSVQVEVKEYVLPRFYSTVRVNPDVLTMTDNWIQIRGTAKYVYGKPVAGKVELKVGVWNGSDVQMFKYNIRAKRIDKKGNFRKNLKTSRLFRSGTEMYKDHKLYVRVDVTEDGTLETDTLEDTSVFINDPYYVVHYKQSKKYFKPGFPYDLKVTTMTKSGRPASGAFMLIQVFYVHENGFDHEGLPITTERKGPELKSKLGKDGKASFTVDTSSDDLETIRFEFTVINMRNKPVVQTVEVQKFKSKSNNFIHINMKNEIEKNRDGTVSLQYTPSLPYEAVKKISLIVISKGHIVFNTVTQRGVDGISYVTLPRKLYTEVSPEMRIVAFYQAEYRTRTEEGNETVIDSLLVDTKDVCVEEIEIQTPYCPRRSSCYGKAVFKPKEEFPVKVKGGPNMMVGLVAVDEAVMLVNDRVTLSRSSMFSELGSHDQGSGVGDGDNLEEVFKNAGLVMKEVDSTVEITPELGRVKTPRRGHHVIDGLDYVLGLREQGHEVKVAPHTVRRYFPETWMFEEHTLNNNGEMILNKKLPDSITTWNFMAVGISADQGVCVSKVKEQQVQMMFFADLRLPYKAVRLEEVKVRLAIYNYQRTDVNILGRITGEEGLCFPSDNVDYAKETGMHFNVSVGREDTWSHEFKMIPTRVGKLKITVDIQAMGSRDVLEKELYVVAEGRREKKSLTFVLDPEAKHVTFKKKNRGKIVLSNSDLVQNKFNIKAKTQSTKIKLAVPKEVIFGTETCSISAFGDLMGDIISHAVVQSRSLMEHPVLDAEEVLGDLSPTVHALLYAKKVPGLLDDKKNKRGHNFVKNAVARLLQYRNKDFSFSLHKASKPATWLTAFVLKTLCYSANYTFVDRRNIIINGFGWLSKQKEKDQLIEKDWRLADDSFEYRVMLSAEVLIALKECDESLDDYWSLDEKDDPRVQLTVLTSDHLKKQVDNIKNPMVVAKVAYALNKYDPECEVAKQAINKLLAMKNIHRGQFFWSLDRQETKDPKKMPFWYKKGAKASSIEATAYALMVFLRNGGTNVDAIADWLVSQRNPNGAFIGAMDSAAAIQALSAYSQEKRIQSQSIDLLCNVTSGHTNDNKHVFKFTMSNATNEEKREDIKVGRTLEVLTQGQGLGQMQVNLEYNVPVDRNMDCPFNLTEGHVEVKEVGVDVSNMIEGNELCSFCNWNCPAIQPVPQSRATISAKRRFMDQFRLTRQNRARRVRGRRSMRRRRQSHLRSNANASKKMICFRVCLEPTSSFTNIPVSVEIEMISGFRPKMMDTEKLKDNIGVQRVLWYEEDRKLIVHFNQVAPDGSTCVAFRAYDDEEIGRPLPANILVRQIDTRDPVCVAKYESPLNQQSLQVFCADSSNTNRGECRCYSGICGKCGPGFREKLDVSQTKNLACQAEIGYQLKMKHASLDHQWYEVEAEVLSVNKSATHNVGQGDSVTLMTPASCVCPVQAYAGSSHEPFYLMSRDVTKLMDRHGNHKYRYLLDHNTNIMRVKDPGQFEHSSGRAALEYYHLHRAYNTCS